MIGNSDWLELPTFTFEIRGTGGSSIHFATKKVLAKHVLLTGVINFDVMLTLSGSSSTFRHSFQCADYSGLRPFRDGLSAIRSGRRQHASISSAGFSLTVRVHQLGILEGLLVEGYCSSLIDLSLPPCLSHEQIGDLVLRNSDSIGNLQFAFLSSLVDPPYVDDAIAQMDRIIEFLEDEGFKP